MFDIDCPLCDGRATTDDGLTRLDCADCGAVVEVIAPPDEADFAVAA